MSDLTIDLTAPNGKKFTLPTGIFIDNEFVKSKSGEKITSINPTSVIDPPGHNLHHLHR
jgi:aldehyde dehydrogenase (NAD+)